MRPLKAEDFSSLENFELLWRWTDPECAVLPESILAQIRVLLPERARQLEEQIHPLCQQLSLFLYNPIPESVSSGSRFEAIRRLRIVEQSDKIVHDWLVSLEIPEDTTILVSWEPKVAVTVPWQIFCEYWDDFCYPGVDDICIHSTNNTWHMVYYHENIFLFGKLRPSP